jgi:replicative DNA helicase
VTDPFTIPDRASEKELRVLIEHNQEIIRHFKRWANAKSYDAACKEYAILRRLVGADEPEEENEDTRSSGSEPAVAEAGHGRR